MQILKRTWVFDKTWSSFKWETQIWCKVAKSLAVSETQLLFLGSAPSDSGFSVTFYNMNSDDFKFKFDHIS